MNDSSERNIQLQKQTSLDSFNHVNTLQVKDQPKNSPGKTIKLIVVVIAFLIFIYWFTKGQIVITPAMIQDKFQKSHYPFHVYCPINKVIQLNAKKDIFEVFSVLMNMAYPQQKQINSQDLRLRMLQYQTYTNISKNGDHYMIFIKFGRINQSDNSSTRFYYCSYVTDWQNRNNCTHAQPICTSPGPIFYVQKDIPIQVAWIYTLDYDKYQVPSYDKSYDCYNSTSNDHHCKLCNKIIDKNYCTYADPTKIYQNKNTFDQDYTIGPKNVPLSVHVHGLQVRPTFDGNPLSWMGKDGSIGIGHMSLFAQQQKNTYYDLFQNQTHTKIMSRSKIEDAIKLFTKFIPSRLKFTNKYHYKINKYQNFQSPGNLWYHDHAMHVTKVNVLLGLAGNYIIHDKNVDSLLPGGKYQIFIIITQQFLTNNSQFINPSSSRYRHQNDNTFGAHVNPIDVKFNVSYPKNQSGQKVPEFERNKVYRVRFLNGVFDALFDGIQFITDCECNNGQKTKNCTFNLTTCKPIQFAIIGSDSSLFNTPLEKQTQFFIASAQRYQILIMFNNSIKSNYVYLVSSSSDVFGHNSFDLRTDNVRFIRNTFKLTHVQSQNTKPIELISQNIKDALKLVPFYDLNKINNQCNNQNRNPDPTSCIINNKMRPFFFQSGGVFHFNGHYRFSQSGKSQKPKIGTTQDWFLINTMISPGINHPIHIHLINFQVIDSTTLKYINGSKLKLSKDNVTYVPINKCTYYQIDFWKGVQKLIPQNVSNNNYSILCDFIRSIDIRNQQTQKLVDQTIHYNQDYTDTRNPDQNVSGLNVMLLIQESDRQIYKDSNCPLSDYKYVCGPLSSSSIPEYYKRWKQVALVKTGVVMRVRIRWASNSYNYQVKKYPFFNVPQDQLMQFPGFVYHCHFLQHEDNELMRPIMMQPSDQYIERYVSSVQRDKLLQSNKTLWQIRYQWINQQVGCN